ncbi:MAG: hypothetical protein QM731_08350 [Chitinophagaceae bacterium]
MQTKELTDFIITIEAAAIYQFILQVSIYSSDNTEMLTANRYPLSITLKKGLYLIRLRANGAVSDYPIALNKDITYTVGNLPAGVAQEEWLAPPRLFSAAPLDRALYQELPAVYSNAVQVYATSITWHTIHPVNASSLFLFMRWSSPERYKDLMKNYEGGLTAYMKQFQLLDGKGKAIVAFDDATKVVTDSKNGWGGLNAGLPPGLYFLSFKGEEERQVPLYLFDGWHTQFFMIIDKGPLFPTIRQFVNKDRKWEEQNRTNLYTDALLDRLQYNQFMIDAAFKQDIQQWAGSIPYLHLLLSYIMATGSGLEENTSEVADDLSIARLISALHVSKLAVAPDIRALALLTDDQAIVEPTDPFAGIPLLRIGFETVKVKGIVQAGLIRTNSLMDLVTETLLSDSCFTTFEPVSIKTDELTRSPTKGVWSRPIMPSLSTLAAPTSSEEETALKILGDRLFPVYIKEQTAEYLNWLGLQIQEVVQLNQAISVQSIAEIIQVPVTTVRRKLDEIKDFLFRQVIEDDHKEKPSRAQLQRAEEELQSLVTQ